MAHFSAWQLSLEDARVIARASAAPPPYSATYPTQVVYHHQMSPGVYNYRGYGGGYPGYGKRVNLNYGVQISPLLEY